MAAEAPEVCYAFRTLLRVAGYAWEFVWHPGETALSEPIDICYGPGWNEVPARIRIRSSDLSFRHADAAILTDVQYREGLPFLRFTANEQPAMLWQDDEVHVASDIVFAAFWLLTGAGEALYGRDRHGNLDLRGLPVLNHDLLRNPAVSIWGAWIRKYFTDRGRVSSQPAWASGSHPAFAFSHDVDYPEMLRAVEMLRALIIPGGGIPLAWRALRGTSHFWQFAEWVRLAAEFGTRPAFYFMARRGSIREYLSGTPDAFYDIGSPRFHGLFRSLREHGCEIGLHASYNAYRDVGTLVREREALEQAADVHVPGNRHHYWHLNPADPGETLAFHEQAELTYDSSLGLEFYPGYRRGICHPFRVFDPRERRELRTIQLPPAWMDDHFGRRLERNGITDPDRVARDLLDAARRSSGVVVVDYHARGMNREYFPRYGAWLEQFLHNDNASGFRFHTPIELVTMHADHERRLAAASHDPAAGDPIVYAVHARGDTTCVD